MKKKKAILFDFDDTLMQTMKSKWDAIRETGRRFYDLDITNKDIKKFWGQSYQQMLTGSLKNIDTFENIRENYESITEEFPMKPYPDALVTINTLLEKYLIGILTASSKKLVLDDFQRLKFPIDKFVNIQTAEDTNVHKPDPKVFDPLLQILKEKGVNKNEIVYIGDSVRDYLAARDAGIDFYGVAHGGGSTSDEFKSEGAHVITCLKSLLTIY